MIEHSAKFSLNSPPSINLRGNTKGSFANTTLKKRVPVTLSKVADDIHRSFCDLDSKLEGSNNEIKIEQGKSIINLISELRHQVQRNKSLSYLDDELEDSEVWRRAQEENFPEHEGYTYLSATWLFSECYVYRKISSILSNFSKWKNYDVFKRLKEESYIGSQKGMIELADRLIESELIEPANSDNKEKAELVFKELIQLALWGNQADLSLLAELKHLDDFHQYSNLSEEFLSSVSDKVLSDNSQQAFDYIWANGGQRIDFILDNSGFELYSDLILADWLLQSGLASQIKFHCKSIPWFVSDTTITDFEWTLTTLSVHSSPSVKALGERWLSYYRSENPKFLVSHDHFFTSPFPYWHLPTVHPTLHSDLKEASLVIFKGDLNYRKLVYDCKWPTTTPFQKAIGPLADSLPVLSLRTAKADPVVGLPNPELEYQLDSDHPDWRVSGKFGMIQFSKPENFP